MIHMSSNAIQDGSEGGLALVQRACPAVSERSWLDQRKGYEFQKTNDVGRRLGLPSQKTEKRLSSVYAAWRTLAYALHTIIATCDRTDCGRQERMEASGAQQQSDWPLYLQRRPGRRA